MNIIDIEKYHFPVKRVFSLKIKLDAEPEKIELAQQLTLNNSKPNHGLMGKYGLFGSQDWWQNIENGTIPKEFIAGRISYVYCSGQDSGPVNAIEVVTSDGNIENLGIYLNDKRDREIFKEGCWVEIVYAMELMKRQPVLWGKKNIGKIALEMVVSEMPVSYT